MEECPVCQHTKISRKFFCEDYFVSHEPFPLACCDACGFTFTEDVPSQEVMSRYYGSSEYVSHSDTKKGWINSVYHRVRKQMIRRKARLIAQRHTGGALLDIGCGTGYFAGTMKQNAWDVLGIEPSETAAEIARNKFGLDIRPPEALCEWPGKSFEAITLWHVLEHLPDLNESMARFFQLLKDNGSLLIALPNIHSYDAQKYRQYWAAYDVPRHLWHFSPDTFSRLAEKHGFQIADIKPMPFDAFYISMLSEKYKKNPLAGLRGFCFGLVSYFICLFDKKRSSSLIYILNKKQ